MPAGADLRDLGAAELRHFGEARGLVLQNVHRLLAKGLDDATGEHRTDALDQPRSEIALNPLERARGDADELVGLELAAVDLVLDPGADRLHVLALPDRLGAADDGDHGRTGELEVARQLDVQDGVAVFVVVEDDALDRPLDRLLAGGVSCGGVSHQPRRARFRRFWTASVTNGAVSPP